VNVAVPFGGAQQKKALKFPRALFKEEIVLLIENGQCIMNFCYEYRNMSTSDPASTIVCIIAAPGAKLFSSRFNFP
jgi:hypothetical protein